MKKPGVRKHIASRVKKFKVRSTRRYPRKDGEYHPTEWRNADS